jgi:ABC-type sugar transport system permease subunit
MGNRLDKESRNTVTAFFFLLPLILLLLCFMAFPVVQCFIRAVHDGKGNFVGLYNLRLFLGETRFATNVRNTIIYVVCSILFIIPTALLAAHLIVDRGIFVNIIRPLYLIPWVIPYICSSILFRSMFYGQGFVPFLIQKITGRMFLFLSDPKRAMIVIVLHQYWRALPFCMLFIAAGLTTIPIYLYEAAIIDGAGKWKKFWHITLPILKSHIFLVTIMATNGALQDSESIWSITGGGPGISTETIAERLFVDSFKNFDLNSASVLGVVLLAIASVFIFLYSRSMKTMEEDIYE